MKETSVVCLPGPSSSATTPPELEEQAKGRKCSGAFSSPVEEDSDVSKSSAKEFDDSCFKAPLLPVKKASSYQSKKKQARTNGQLKGHNGGDLPCLSPLSISGSSQGSSQQQQPSKKADDHPELLDEFVSIGKHAFLCPHSRQYIACQFPNLPQKRPSQPEEQMVKEVIIDEFSLLLFASLEDYNLLKIQEDEQKEREDNEEKRKINEENLRLGKVKKKGRKSKVDLEKERKTLKKKAKHERRELKRQRHEQKALKRREEHSQLTPQQREERRKEKRERINLNKQLNGQPPPLKLSKEAKQKQKEDQRRLKKEKKVELKNQKRLASCGGAPGVAAASVSDPQSTACTSSMATAVATHHPANPSGEPVDWRSITATSKPAASSPASKRPASAIGIASPQRNGVILSPIDNLHSANTPPANKVRKVSTEAGAPDDSKAFIGISVGKPENNQQIKTEFGRLEENSTNSKICTSSQPSTSRPDTSTHFGQEPLAASLQQAFLNNPEFAKNYHHSMASLRAVDASLLGIAGGTGLGSPFPFYTSSQILQQLEQQQRTRAAAPLPAPKNEVNPASHVPFLQSVGATLPLASQLAGVAALANKTSFLNTTSANNASQLSSANTSAATNNRQQAKSRWCCMHVTIAHEVARHMEASKNPSKAGDANSGQHNLATQHRFTTTAAANNSTVKTSQQHKQQQRLQQSNNTASKTTNQPFNTNPQMQQQAIRRAGQPSMSKQSNLGEFSSSFMQQNPLIFGSSGSSTSSKPPAATITHQANNNNKLPPNMLAPNGVPSSLAAAQQLSALGFPLAPPQFGVSGSLTSGTSAQAASLNAALGQNTAANAQQMAFQLAMLSQLGLNLPPPPLPSFNSSLQQQLPSSYTNHPLTSLLNSSSSTSTANNRMLNNNPGHLQHNSQAEAATQNALLQAALLQGIQSLENKAVMQQQPMDLMRQQQQMLEQTAVMQQHQQLLDRFNANNQNHQTSSLLLQQHQQQQALQNGMLFANSIDQEMLMRQRLFAQLSRPDAAPSSSTPNSTAPKSASSRSMMPPTSTAQLPGQQGGMEAIMAEFARQQMAAASNGAPSNMFNSLAATQQQSINNFGGANSRAT